MSNAVTIKLSRNARVEENIDVAKLTLDKFIEHKQGQPLIVRYYRDVEKDGRIEKIIDTLVAIGTKDGKGRDCYSLLTTSGEREVNGIYETLPDVSLLVNGAIYISRVKGVLSLVYIGENHTTRYIEPIKEKEVIFRNLADGYRWFYIDNTIRKETDILTLDQVTDLINTSIEKIHPAQINIQADRDIYKQGEVSSVIPIFTINVIDYNGDNITEDCELEFYIVSEKQNISKFPGNRFVPSEPISETTTYTVKVKYKERYIGTQNVSIKFLLPSYYGKTDNNLVEFMWDKETEPEKEFNIDLNDEVMIFKVPYELTKILDIHGLDYIDDYTKTRVGDYFVYRKLDRVVINNFKQVIS